MSPRKKPIAIQGSLQITEELEEFKKKLKENQLPQKEAAKYITCWKEKKMTMDDINLQKKSKFPVSTEDYFLVPHWSYKTNETIKKRPIPSDLLHYFFDMTRAKSYSIKEFAPPRDKNGIPEFDVRLCLKAAIDPAKIHKTRGIKSIGEPKNDEISRYSGNIKQLLSDSLYEIRAKRAFGLHKSIETAKFAIRIFYDTKVNGLLAIESEKIKKHKHKHRHKNKPHKNSNVKTETLQDNNNEKTSISDNYHDINFIDSLQDPVSIKNTKTDNLIEQPILVQDPIPVKTTNNLVEQPVLLQEFVPIKNTKTENDNLMEQPVLIQEPVVSIKKTKIEKDKPIEHSILLQNNVSSLQLSQKNDPVTESDKKLSEQDEKKDINYYIKLLQDTISQWNINSLADEKVLVFTKN